MTALEDVETQRNGVVLVGINVGPKRAVDRTAVWTTQRVRKTLPIRVTGMHYCYDDFKMRPMMSIAMLVMGATSRVRFRAHYGALWVTVFFEMRLQLAIHFLTTWTISLLRFLGKPEDNQFKLSTFGIPIQALPLTADGGPKVKYHRQWLKSRRDQEELQSSDEIIVIPGRLDVLLGRGKPIQEHYGNQRYHVLLDKYQNAYELAKKFEKMQIADRIVQSVHEYSGHFLRQDGARWVIVDDIMARNKVSHAFRTRRAASGTSAAATSKMPNINLKNIGTKRRTSEESETPGSSLSGTDSKRRVISWQRCHWWQWRSKMWFWLLRDCSEETFSRHRPSSRRCTRFLTYSIRTTLNERGDNLELYILRPSSFLLLFVGWFWSWSCQRYGTKRASIFSLDPSLKTFDMVAMIAR